VAECEQLCSDYGPDCKGFEMYENHGGGGNGLVPGDIHAYIYIYIHIYTYTHTDSRTHSITHTNTCKHAHTHNRSKNVRALGGLYIHT
jgi:hypothetical protein